MPRLPDRFDLWVRRAKESPDPARQADYVLGALAGLKEWHFLNLGTSEKPRSAEVELDGANYLLLFTDTDRIDELVAPTPGQPLPLITMPTSEAMVWCLKRAEEGCAGILVNPGEDAFAVSLGQLEEFHREWSQRGGRQASGFWIPNMTTEEEDFWQQHGI